MAPSFSTFPNRNLPNQSHPHFKTQIKNHDCPPCTERTSNLPKVSQHVFREIRTIYQKANFSIPGHYEITQILGKGSYGVVVSATNKSNGSTTSRIAIKKVTNIFHREILLKRAIRELKFLNYFKGHKNIVCLMDLEIVSEKPYDGLYCYQELIDYDLAKVIHSTVQFSEFHIKYFLYQILCGLKYIHSAEVIHRDLKPGNILCTVNGTLKICDFGLARGIAPQFLSHRFGSHQMTNYVATRWYRAPELILSHNNYTKAIDIWAVGCILAEFYARKPVFMGQNSLHQASEILKVLGPPNRETIVKYGSTKAWEFFSVSKVDQKSTEWSKMYPFASPEAVSLLNHLLQWDPEKRLNVEEAITQPFLLDVRNSDDEPTCPHGPFDFSYEDKFTTMRELRECIHEEVNSFKYLYGVSNR